MAMNRSGLKSLMGYQAGGGLSTLTTPDYQTSLEKYQERLQPFAQTTPPVSGFEALSMIGKGLLAQQGEKFPSMGRGLGMGFQQLADETAKRNELKRKEHQAIGFKAMELALQDEQQAQKFLNDYTLKLLDLANKPLDLTTLEYVDSGGNKIQKTFKSNDPEIMDLLEQGAIEVKAPQSAVNIDMGGMNKLDENRAKKISDTEGVWQTEADAALAVRDQIAYARTIAENLGPSGFGPVEQFTVAIRGVLNDLGFNIDVEKLSDQQLMGQLGTGFAMSLVGQTKGAISNREMDMFLRASPTLGATYEGFMKMLDYLDRIAERTESMNEQWGQRSVELAAAKATIPEIQAEMAKFKQEFHKNNPLFNKDEFNELQNIKDQSASDYKAVDDVYQNAIKSTDSKVNPNTSSGYAQQLIQDILDDETLDEAQKAQKIQEVKKILGQ